MFALFRDFLSRFIFFLLIFCYSRSPSLKTDGPTLIHSKLTTFYFIFRIKIKLKIFESFID
uniref:Putative ovule protein n=1 Tax=Solanum chacoense TaxID=4108 RepID=A0A0V0GV66_SOLCH